MLITNVSEILSIIIVTFIIGYIFSGYIKRPGIKIDSFGNFKFALMVTAPAILLHEFGHKFASIAFGVPAYFQIWAFGLILGLIFRFLNSPFLILAPGYVLITQDIPSPQMALVAFAGPLVNILLFFISSLMLKKRRMKRKTYTLLYLTKTINLWLFIFNMLPIPPLDGSKVFGYLLGFY